MAITSIGRGPDTHSIKITLGYEPETGKRLYYTETFKGKKKDARLREAELKIQKRAKKLTLSSGMTFNECFSDYCDETRSRLSLNCFHNYVKVVKRHLIPSLGHKKLKSLMKDDFQKVYDSMSARGLSPRTVYTLHSVTRAVITWAKQKGLVGEHILEDLKLPKIPKPRPEYLSYEEMQAFFDAAPKLWYGSALKFQFLTGLRNQELLALTWEDVNFETDELLISRACIWINGSFKGFKSTKTGDARTLELDPPTIDFLRSLKAAQELHISSRRSLGLSYEDNRLVFCRYDGCVPNDNAVRRCFKRILKNIGVTRPFRWYGVRHTHATQMLDVEGANPKMIADRLGHSVQMLFNTYAHQMRGQQRKALSQISARVIL